MKPTIKIKKWLVIIYPFNTGGNNRPVISQLIYAKHTPTQRDVDKLSVLYNGHIEIRPASTGSIKL